MQLTVKSVVGRSGLTETTLYTVPATKSVVANSLIATGLATSPLSVVLQKANGDRSNLVNNLNITAGSSADVLVGTVNMSEGDSIRVSAPDAVPWSSVDGMPTSGLFGTVYRFMTFNDDTVYCATSTGLYRATDGVNFSQVSSTAFSSGTTGWVYAFGKYHIYTSATSKRESTDGLTWTTVACTNAPNSAMLLAVGAPILHIVDVSGTDYLYTLSGDNLVRSLGGTSFTVASAVTGVTGANSLIKIGSRFIVSGTGGGIAYTDNNGGTWTASVGGATNISGNGGGRLANIGNYVVFNGHNGTDASVRVSTDAGVSFTNISTQLGISGAFDIYGCINYGTHIGILSGGAANCYIIDPNGSHVYKTVNGWSISSTDAHTLSRLVKVSTGYRNYTGTIGTTAYQHFYSSNQLADTAQSLTLSYTEVTA